MFRRFQGAVLASLYGAIAAIPWIVLSYFGWLASIAGYLIGIAAFKGYEKGAGFFDRFGKVCILLVILAVVPAAEIIGIFIAALNGGYAFHEALIYAPLIFIEYIGDYVPNILVGYFMAGLGSFRVFTLQTN